MFRKDKCILIELVLYGMACLVIFIPSEMSYIGFSYFWNYHNVTGGKGNIFSTPIFNVSLTFEDALNLLKLYVILPFIQRSKKLQEKAPFAVPWLFAVQIKLRVL